MKDYMVMFNEAMDVVRGLGIETGNIVDVSLNYRAKDRTGQCRCANYENLGIESPKEERKHNYVFVCEDCGQVIIRERASKFTKNYHDYRCGKCGGKFKFDADKSNYQLLTARPKYSYVENR